MLVYAKNPLGILHIPPYRIYGSRWGQDPTDIPFKVYLACRNEVEDAPYREGYLSRLFKKDFPEVSFTYSLLKFLPEKTIDNIGPLMVTNFDKSWSFKKKIDQIKLALVNVN